MLTTTDELAQRLGLAYHDYDTALDQQWVDETYRLIGIRPQMGDFVWSYKGAGVFGRPVALTEAGRNIERLLKLRADAIELASRVERLRMLVRVGEEREAYAYVTSFLAESEAYTDRIMEAALRA